MPSPLELLLDPVSLTILLMYSVLWEFLLPARKLPEVSNWRIKGIISFLIFFFLSSYLPLLYSAWLPETQLLDLTQWNIGLAAVTGVFVYEFGLYVWHRSMHKSNALWRVFHQMHHSAERLDAAGAFFFSPMDMIGFTLLGTICFSLITGLPPQSITIVLLTTNFLSVFQHANIKTPIWLGYLIQRPESHAVHHAKGIHAFNYSDLPVFDILFRTFRNPQKYVEATGFYEGASDQIKDMLLFKDISKLYSE